MLEKYAKDTEAHKKLLKASYVLLALITLIVVFITITPIYRLYSIGFEQQKEHMLEIVENQAATINGIAAHEMQEYKSSKIELEEEVLEHLLDAEFVGFGKTGEYTIAKVDKDTIHFLLRHGQDKVDTIEDISMTHSKLAEPMRKALNGNTGVYIGPDDRGTAVLAAYMPIKSLGWGVVAKIDLFEIRAPYIKETLYKALGGIFIILLGTIIIRRLIYPLIQEIELGREYIRMLFNESPIGFALTDFDGNILDVNLVFSKLVGYTSDELFELGYSQLTPKEYLEQDAEQKSNLMRGKPYGPYEKEFIHKRGHYINVRTSGCLIKRDGKMYIWLSIEDITEHISSQRVLKEAALVFENTHESIMITDENVKILRINSPFTKITGYTFDEVLGQDPSFLQSGAHDESFYKYIWKTIKEKGSWYGELRNRKKNGEYFTTMQSITAIKDKNGRISGYVCVFSDISKRKIYEKELLHLATHDPLTSLPNRIHFHDNLKKALQSAKRNKHKVGVLFLDLNGFKKVNDTMGHEVGDALLIEVANRSKECLREADTVARLGGDEFAIILPQIKSSDDAVEVAQKIIQRVSETFYIGKKSLTPSTSIGISIYPDHGDDRDTLLKLADKAMYIAKERKDGNCELFDATKEYA